MQVFQECQTRDAAGNTFELSMIRQKGIGAYVKNKKNQNQNQANQISIYQECLASDYLTLDNILCCMGCRFAGYGRK